MRKMSKYVRIAVTLILTLSMVLGSYVGVFAAPAASGIGKYVTVVVQDEEWDYVQASDGDYRYSSWLGKYVDWWLVRSGQRYDYVKVQDKVTQQVWQAGTMTINPSSKNMEYNDTSSVNVTISDSDYDFDNGTYGWTSSDTSVVNITSTSKTSGGKVTTANIRAMGPGTSTITMQATINGVSYTKTCVVTVFAYIGHVDVDEDGKISYVAQETYNGAVTQAPAQLTNASISNVGISIQGYDQWVYDIGDQFRAYTNHWNDFYLSTQTNFDGQVTVIIDYTISGYAANGDYISKNVTDTVSYAEALAAFKACPNKTGLDFTFVYNYLINTNYYDVKFIDGKTDPATETSVNKVIEDGYVLSGQVPPAATYEEVDPDDGTIIVHEFEGWLFNNSGTPLDAAQVAATPITANTTFVASYSNTSYNTVLFQDGDGNDLGSLIRVQQGTSVTSVPETATQLDKIEGGVKTTYEFNGTWKDDAGNIYTSEALLTLPINSNTIFTAQFDATEHYTVIFEDKYETELGRVEYVTDGSSVDSSDVPVVSDTDVSDGSGTRTTNVFEGWFDKETGDPIDPSTETIGSNRTFVADVTTTNFFTINFYDENGNLIPELTTEVQQGNQLNPVPEGPAKADVVRDGSRFFYTFAEWILMQEETEGPQIMAFMVEEPVISEEPSVFDNIQGPMNFMASYDENQYVLVNFYVQLPTGTRVLIDTQYVKPGDDATDPSAAWLKTNNYTLGAWNGSLTGIEVDTDLTARAANVAGAVETNTRQPVVAGAVETGSVAGATEVQTGDTTPIVSMSILLAAAAFSIIFVSARKRKNA